MNKIIAPSILSADFLNLENDIKMLNKSDAKWLHLDVMDGLFVPNISFGIPVIKAIRKATDKILDTHLMIQNPSRYIDLFADAGCDVLTIHYEAETHIHRTIQAIKSRGMKAGISLNPHTPVSVLSDVICDLDLVLIMSVNPGFGGQKFIENTYSKVEELKKIINQKKSNALIEIDGGVSIDNCQKLFDFGADILVSGSAIFNSDNPTNYIKNLLKK